MLRFCVFRRPQVRRPATNRGCQQPAVGSPRRSPEGIVVERGGAGVDRARPHMQKRVAGRLFRRLTGPEAGGSRVGDDNAISRLDAGEVRLLRFAWSTQHEACRVTCALDRLMGRATRQMSWPPTRSRCRSPLESDHRRIAPDVAIHHRGRVRFWKGYSGSSGLRACSDLSHVRVAARRSIPTQPRGRGRFPSGPPVGPSRSSQEGSGSSAGP